MKDLLELKEKIKDADMILLGIGEELSLKHSELLKEHPIHKRFEQEMAELSNEAKEFVQDALYMNELKKGEHPKIRELLYSYRQLQNLVEGKNLFVVTTCNDDVIDLTGFPMDRVVKPCGTRELMQCQENCSDEVIETEELYTQIYAALENMYEKDVFFAEEIQKMIPHCSKCQAYMKHNMVGSQGYSEQGYLPQWKRYTMWLQGTLNKQLCLIELGESFRYPTVIRWPFEKVANLNQKSVMVRVNETLPQVTKEIAERSYSVAMNSREFLEKITAIRYEEQIRIEEDEDVKAE